MEQDDRSKDGRGKVRLSGQLMCTSQEEVDLILRLLPEHIRLTQGEPGCLAFEVTQTDDPMIWHVEECFTDGAAFEAHQARTRASLWGAETKAIRREYEISTAS